MHYVFVYTYLYTINQLTNYLGKLYMILENCGDRTLTMALDDIKRTSIDSSSSTLIREDL